MSESKLHIQEEKEQIKEKPLVLVVDDEYDNCLQVGYALRDHFEVIFSFNGYEAIEKCKNYSFEALLIDQRMPDMTGAELCYHLVEMQYPAERILITAYQDFEGLSLAINEGKILRFILKPWERWQLVAAVMESVEITRLRLSQKEEIKKLHSELSYERILRKRYEEALGKKEIEKEKQWVKDFRDRINIKENEKESDEKKYTHNLPTPCLFIQFLMEQAEEQQINTVSELIYEVTSEYGGQVISLENSEFLATFYDVDIHSGSYEALSAALALVDELQGFISTILANRGIEGIYCLMGLSLKGFDADYHNNPQSIPNNFLEHLRALSDGERIKLDKYDNLVTLVASSEIKKFCNFEGFIKDVLPEDTIKEFSLKDGTIYVYETNV